MTLDSQTSNGHLFHESNELRNVALDNDAAAYRGEAPRTQRILVKFVGDVTRSDGKADTVGGISIKQSETNNVVDGRLGGELYIGLRIPGSSSNDAAEFKIANAIPPDPERGDPGGWWFDVPIFAPNLGAGGSALEIVRMWAPNGRSFTQQQDDGNFVTYTTTVPFSIAPEHVTAVWSAWTGKIETTRKGAPSARRRTGAKRKGSKRKGSNRKGSNR